MASGEAEAYLAKTTTILDEAKRLITGDRDGDYGPPSEDFETTALMLSGVLSARLRKSIVVDPSMVPILMSALKLRRESHKPKRDNDVDNCGYAGCKEMAEDKWQKQGYWHELWQHFYSSKSGPVVWYLASPYTADDDLTRRSRAAVARRVTGRLLQGGIHVYSPISYSVDLVRDRQLPDTWEFWREFSAAMVSAASAVCVLKLGGWEKSVGVAAEIELATEQGKPVVYIVEGGCVAALRQHERRLFTLNGAK